MSSLFRKQALAHKSHKLCGNVIIAQPVTFTSLIVSLLLMVIVAVSYLIFTDYNRKESVKGYLQPSYGIAKAYLKNSGVLANLHVREGDIVNKGDVLADIEISHEFVNGNDINQHSLTNLQLQLHRLHTQLSDEQTLQKLSKERLLAHQQHLNAIIYQQQQQHVTLNKRLVINELQYNDGKALFAKGYLSKQQLRKLEDQHLQLSQQQEALKQTLFRSRSELNQAQLEISQLPLLLVKQQTVLHNKLDAVKQQIYQAQYKQSYQIKANRSGRITNVLGKVGQTMAASKPLLTILPEQGNLQAILFVPTHSFGFVHKGQQTLLRYQAFPYQRFGVFTGQISEVAKAVLLPNDLNTPVGTNEPVYKVTVKLNQQYISAYGKQMALHPGMLLEADILLEKRSLWHWLLEPIYSLKGRI